jgi:ribosomal protein S18 acetylase RimI-like enzyme
VNEPPGFTERSGFTPFAPFTIGPLAPSHRGRVAEILRSTANFRDEEVDVALELFDASFGGEDYVFVGAFQREPGTGNREPKLPSEPRFPVPGSPFPSIPDSRFPIPLLVGFACYGPSMATDRTYDLYWIAVDRAAQGTGCGSVLLAEVERRLEALHARMLVVETSSRSDYTATRGFYLKRGYVEAARVREFYATDDDRIILTKRFALSPREGWGAVA